MDATSGSTYKMMKDTNNNNKDKCSILTIIIKENTNCNSKRKLTHKASGKDIISDPAYKIMRCNKLNW